MTSRHVITLRNEGDLAKAMGWLKSCAYGFRVEVKEPKRSDMQNDRMWWLLTAISKGVLWHGQNYSPDDWKDYFCHILNGGRFMPDERGGLVPIGRRTSQMSKSEMSELQALMEIFCAKYGVILDHEKDSTKGVK